MDNIVHFVAFVAMIVVGYLHARLVHEKRLMLLLLTNKRKYIFCDPIVLFRRLAKVFKIKYKKEMDFFREKKLIKIEIALIKLLFTQLDIRQIVFSQEKNFSYQIKLLIKLAKHDNYTKTAKEKINSQSGINIIIKNIN